MPKRPTPCPRIKSVNSQEELIAKLIFLSRASRGVSFLFPSPGLSQNDFFLCASRGVFPNEGLSHHVSRLKTVFFPRASRGVCFFFHQMQASPRTEWLSLGFPTNRFALPGLPHEQNCSTWASPRTDPVCLSSPTNRIIVLGFLDEQNCR